MIQSIDHVALLPAYLAVGTAVLVLLLDLALAPGSPVRRGVLLATAALGVAGTGVSAVLVGLDGRRATFCTDASTLVGRVEVERSCSYVADRPAAVVAVLFCVLTLGVLALSVPALSRPERTPAGEYVFLLLCSLVGAVVLGYSRDLITLLVALETLTLPLYVLVGLRRGVLASITGAVNFYVVSVISTAVTLLGAALLYATTGAVHLDRLAAALGARGDLRAIPLVYAAVVLVLVGLAFKVAAVPFHAWAPGTYDGAPLPVAGYLSTASKLGGVVALLYVTVGALRPWLDLVGPVLAVLAVATMTLGNLVALRQHRMVRLLAWSSVAQAGYILAPLGAFALAAGRADPAVLVAATIGYAAFYVLIELGAFGAVIGIRGDADGGLITAYQGTGWRTPWLAGAFVLALVGLAGLPPGLAGLFAKIVVIRALLETHAGWLAVAVALNAVVGLAYYVRVAALLFAPAPAPSHVSTSDAPAPAGPPGEAEQPVTPRLAWPVAVAVATLTVAALVVGFAPQLVLDAADAATHFTRR